MAEWLRRCPATYAHKLCKAMRYACVSSNLTSVEFFLDIFLKSWNPSLIIGPEVQVGKVLFTVPSQISLRK